MAVLFSASALPIGAIWGGYRLERRPSFCNSCHEMQPSVAAWKTSGANKGHPDCITCHSGAGLGGVLESQVRGLRMMGLHFFGDPKSVSEIRAKMPETYCLKCHAAESMVEAHALFKPPDKPVPTATNIAKAGGLRDRCGMSKERVLFLLLVFSKREDKDFSVA